MITLHYTMSLHETHPYAACIVSDIFIGPVVRFRDEGQMNCYAAGFLQCWEMDSPITQTRVELKPAESLPTEWDRRKAYLLRNG